MLFNGTSYNRHQRLHQSIKHCVPGGHNPMAACPVPEFPHTCAKGSKLPWLSAQRLLRRRAPTLAARPDTRGYGGWRKTQSAANSGRYAQGETGPTQTSNTICEKCNRFPMACVPCVLMCVASVQEIWVCCLTPRLCLI